MELFNKKDSEKLLNFCEHQKLAILGIEGFNISGDKITPDLDFIADFSCLATTDKKYFIDTSIKSARKFLELITDNDLLLEFVLVRN
ncbi:hypothetical protein BTW07_03100 [Salinicola socius]|uniref:Uncharacterized protein n=2 Tax=Halomonadaceae TaxID=28256 RepID=A0A1Q8SVN5_9GAMM|nr:hypothetical protein BTW07_03100 [Salinicola socius]